MPCSTIPLETDGPRAEFTPDGRLLAVTELALRTRMSATGDLSWPTRLYASMGHSAFRSKGIASSGCETEAPAEGVGGVLIVDDNADLADMAELLLAAHGLKAIVAYSGAEALDVLAAHPEISAVVSDVVMPGMNGIELADRIAERYPTVKIVFVSGFISPDVSHGEALRHILLAKPYRIEQLIALL